MMNEHNIKAIWPEYQTRNVNNIQHGGDHYKKYGSLQPWDVITAWNLGYLDGTALKYIARWRDKGGIEDIQKAIHFLEKVIEVETAKKQKPVKQESLPNDSWGSK